MGISCVHAWPSKGIDFFVKWTGRCKEKKFDGFVGL